MSQHIHDQIRAVVAKAEARINKTRIRKLAAEQERHDARKAEIHREADQELEVARAALALIPKESDDEAAPVAGTNLTAEHFAAFAETDDPPNMVEVPAALREPSRPSERLTGKARER